MRSLECLVHQYPEKTGKQLLAIQEQDKLFDEKEYQKRFKKQHDLIHDINTNGGYYKGRFGENQHFYYSFTNLMLLHGEVKCDVQTIVGFTGEKISLERRDKTYQNLDNYGLSTCERTTKEEYDMVSKYLDDFFNKFFEDND